MALDGNSYYCDYCGKYIGEGTSNAGPTPVPPRHAVTERYNLIFMRVFCSKKCKDDFKK